MEKSELDIELCLKEFLNSEYVAGDIAEYGAEDKKFTHVYRLRDTIIKVVKFQGNFEYDICDLYEQLNFPNIVKIFKCFKYKGYIITIMENLEPIGNNFSSFEESLNFLRSCVNAMSWLQNKKISHNDIKIDNIMRTHSGVYKIIDFDYMTIDKNKGEFNDYTNEKSLLKAGTNGYISPERCDLGPSGCNAYKCDVYSLGVTFLTMIYNTIQNSNHMPVQSYKFNKCLDSLTGEFQRFKEIIRVMINNDPWNRPDFKMLSTLMFSNFKIIEVFNASCEACGKLCKETNLLIIENRSLICRECLKFLHLDLYLYFIFRMNEKCIICKSEKHKSSCAANSGEHFFNIKCPQQCEFEIMKGISYFRKCEANHFTCIVCFSGLWHSHETCSRLYSI